MPRSTRSTPDAAAYAAVAEHVARALRDYAQMRRLGLIADTSPMVTLEDLAGTHLERLMMSVGLAGYRAGYDAAHAEQRDPQLAERLEPWEATKEAVTPVVDVWEVDYSEMRTPAETPAAKRVSQRPTVPVPPPGKAGRTVPSFPAPPPPAGWPRKR